MMRRIFLLVIILILMPTFCHASNGIKNIIVEEQLDLFNTKELQMFIDDILMENRITDGMKFRDMISNMVKGERFFSKDRFIKYFGDLVVGEIKINLEFISKILVLCLISAILTNIQSSFERSSISSLANYITYILVAMIMIGGFYQLMEAALKAVNSMVKFMDLLLPVLLTFLVIAGGPQTKIMFHPMIILTVNGISFIIVNIIFPLIYFSFIVSILSNLSDRIELKKLSELARQIISFIISAAFTVFIGLMTIYGLSSKMDGISIRTAKFAIDNFVPIVGGFLSDTVDTVIGFSAMLKNGIGVIGLIVLMVITLFPVIKVAALLLIYKVTGAVIEPIVSKNISGLFSDVGKTLLMILISMVSISIMFFIAITVIVDAGNSLLMLR